MASSKDALRRQRRRELDARRSKSRVRLGACLPRWGRLKDSLGFTLHSELAQFLLESYLSKVDSKCSYVGERESAIMASVEALNRLVQLVHCHGQGCPHLPTLLQQSAAGKPMSDPCPGQRRSPGRRPELGTWASSDPENRPSSTGAGLPGSPETPDGELCLSYVCESGHTLSWSPETQGGFESEGGGKGVPLTADPPRKQGQRQGSKAVREGTSVEVGGTVMRTRSRSGVQRMETRRLTAQRAAGGAGEKEQEEEEEEEEEEEVRSSMSTGTDGTQEDSGQVETDTGNVAVPTGFPQTSQPCTDIATSPRVTKTNPDKRSSDISKNTARPSRRSNRTSVSNDEAPLIVNKRKRKANPKEILLCTYEGCEKIFSSRQYLNHHMKYQHIQQKTFSCSHASCGKAFNFKKHLKEHEKLHSNQRDYICEFCARAFRTNSNLIIHRRIHTGEKPLQCEVCGFTCCQKASLNWHMKKHNAESSYQFPCDICGRRFEKRDNVTAHRSKSHPEHPTPASSGPPDPVTSSDLSTAPSVSVSEDPKQ